MDSFDITQETGDYSLQIAGMSYPQKSLSSLMNRAGIMNELRRAMGSLYNNNNSMSINYYEFATGDGDTTDITKPGKFWVGFNLQKLTIESKAFLVVYQLKTRLLLLLLILPIQHLKPIMLC